MAILLRKPLQIGNHITITVNMIRIYSAISNSLKYWELENAKLTKFKEFFDILTLKGENIL